MVYLNYRNEHIWPPTRKWLHIFETFHLASLQFITFDHFLSLHLFLKSISEIFYISIWWTSFWLFGHHTFSYKLLSFFPNRILVCVTVFAAHYLFLFWHLHWLSSLSIYIYIYIYERVGRYINTSLHMYQNQHDYQLIIYDKIKDWFTTITQMSRFFPHW